MVLSKVLLQFELFPVTLLLLRLTNKDGQNNKASDREEGR